MFSLRIRLVFFLLISGLVVLPAQEGSWTCAITSFRGNLSEENSFLLRHFPLQIYHKISDYPDHVLSPEEKVFLSKESERAARNALIDKWASLQDQRDGLIFEPDPKKYSSLTKEMNGIRAQLDGSPVREESRDIRAFKLLTPGGGALIFDSPGELEIQDPDLILSGRIDRTGDYYLLEITGRQRSSGSDSFETLWLGAGTGNELDRLAREAADSLKPLLLGREWASLEVKTVPEEGQIFLNGSSLGIGAVAEEILVPGPAELEIRFPGYKIYRENINLDSGERKVMTVDLVKGEEDLIQIVSNPAGAGVILGSSYMGVTPLILPKPRQEQTLSLEKGGYDSAALSLGPDSPDRLEVSLTSAGIDWEEMRVTRKNQFYNSLGYFTLSLAVPLVSYGVMENQANLANKYANLYSVTSTDAVRSNYYEAMDNFYISQGIMWGGVAVSTALLGVSITRLVQYIKASEKSIRQTEKDDK